jgi:hypothetical protein
MSEITVYAWRMVKEMSDYGQPTWALYGRDDMVFGAVRRDIYGVTDKGMAYLIPEAIEVYRSPDGDTPTIVEPNP